MYCRFGTWCSSWFLSLQRAPSSDATLGPGVEAMARYRTIMIGVLAPVPVLLRDGRLMVVERQIGKSICRGSPKDFKE